MRGRAAVTPEAARRFAERVHAGTADRSGLPLLDHVRRVAALTPREARSVAWLHEVLEVTDRSADALRAAGATPDEIRAVELLTRAPSTDPADYDAHVRRIADAPGRAGELARTVKRADLHDRLRHQGACSPSAPHPSYRRALTVLGAAVR